MDQGPLVTEQIDAGAKLAGEFAAKYKPLQAAFWLKESEYGQWFLYLVSDQIDDTNFDQAYGEVHRLLGRGPHLWLDPFQVKVAGVYKPVAKAVLELQQEYPGSIPTRLRNRMLGGLSVEEVYIYALPIAVSH
jgi:hypothetical protein